MFPPLILGGVAHFGSFHSHVFTLLRTNESADKQKGGQKYQEIKSARIVECLTYMQELKITVGYDGNDYHEESYSEKNSTFIWFVFLLKISVIKNNASETRI